MMRETSFKKNKKNKRDKKNKGCLNIKLLVSQLFIVKYETEIVLTAYKNYLLYFIILYFIHFILKNLIYEKRKSIILHIYILI